MFSFRTNNAFGGFHSYSFVITRGDQSIEEYYKARFENQPFVVMGMSDGVRGGGAVVRPQAELGGVSTRTMIVIINYRTWKLFSSNDY